MFKKSFSLIRLRIFAIFTGLFSLWFAKIILQFLLSDLFMKISLLVISIFFVILIIKPLLIKKIYLFWISCFNNIEDFISTLLLGIIFIFVLQPISLIANLLGFDPLRIKNNRKGTYRQKRSKTKINLKKLY